MGRRKQKTKLAGIGVPPPEQDLPKEPGKTYPLKQSASDKQEPIKDPPKKDPLNNPTANKGLPKKDPPNNLAANKGLPKEDPPNNPTANKGLPKEDPPNNLAANKEAPKKVPTKNKAAEEEPPNKDVGLPTKELPTREAARDQRSNDDRTIKCYCSESKTDMLKDSKNLSIPKLQNLVESLAREITAKDRQLRKTRKLTDMLLEECRNFKLYSANNKKQIADMFVQLEKSNAEFDELQASYEALLKENEAIKKKTKEKSSEVPPFPRLPRIHKHKRTRQGEENPKK